MAICGPAGCRLPWWQGGCHDFTPSHPGDKSTSPRMGIHLQTETSHPGERYDTSQDASYDIWQRVTAAGSPAALPWRPVYGCLPGESVIPDTGMAYHKAPHKHLSQIWILGNILDSKVHGGNMGPIWGRQDPGGPHVGPMNFAIWDMQSEILIQYTCCTMDTITMLYDYDIIAASLIKNCSPWLCI